MEEPNVLISYATANNTPFDTIDNLFIDSGGYSLLKHRSDYQTSNQEYLDYVEKHGPELFTLRDYSCEPSLLRNRNKTVHEHQQLTTKNHRELLNSIERRGIESQPVTVIQGWKPHEYLDHLDNLQANGLLTEYVAIGSICRRHQTKEVNKIIHTVRRELPQKYKLHAFGVKTRVLKSPQTMDALDSADSTAYDYRTRVEAESSNWKNQVYHYLSMKQEIEACKTNLGLQRTLQKYR
jgi:queuine/archaeosine tRNA-ribosyltransferase